MSNQFVLLAKQYLNSETPDPIIHQLITGLLNHTEQLAAEATDLKELVDEYQEDIINEIGESAWPLHAVTTELFKAGLIINNALNIMTSEQKMSWAIKNNDSKVLGDDGNTIRLNERVQLFKRLERKYAITVCRGCGCTELCACPGGCHWVEPNLCSACQPADEAV